MNKEIHIYYINKIKNLDREIFEEEDNDYVDFRVIANKWRAIENCFKKANITDKKLRQEVLDNVCWTCDTCAENLEKLGWTIIRGKENL